MSLNPVLWYLSDHTDNITPDGISGTGFEVIENDRQEAAYVARNIEVISFQPK